MQTRKRRLFGRLTYAFCKLTTFAISLVRMVNSALYSRRTLTGARPSTDGADCTTTDDDPPSHGVSTRLTAGPTVTVVAVGIAGMFANMDVVIASVIRTVVRIEAVFRIELEKWIQIIE